MNQKRDPNERYEKGKVKQRIAESPVSFFFPHTAMYCSVSTPGFAGAEKTKAPWLFVSTVGNVLITAPYLTG
jgi:hypothetical protein